MSKNHNLKLIELRHEPNFLNMDPQSIIPIIWHSPNSTTHWTTPNWQHIHLVVISLNKKCPQTFGYSADGRQRTMMTKRIMENNNHRWHHPPTAPANPTKRGEKIYILIHHLNQLFANPCIEQETHWFIHSTYIY